MSDRFDEESLGVICEACAKALQLSLIEGDVTVFEFLHDRMRDACITLQYEDLEESFLISFDPRPFADGAFADGASADQGDLREVTLALNSDRPFVQGYAANPNGGRLLLARSETDFTERAVGRIRSALLACYRYRREAEG